MLSGGCFLLPTTVWASSIYPPSGAAADATVQDTGDPNSNVLAFCFTGLIPSAAACNTGSISGYSTTGDAYMASAFSNAAPVTGGLTVTTVGVGADAIYSTADAFINDTLYFHGATAGQMGQITMTATGTLSGNLSAVSESLTVCFL
jgi:hypothetical protein